MASKKSSAAVVETTEHGAVRERIDMGHGSVSLLRGGDGPPLLFLHAAGGVGEWLPIHGLMADSFDVFAPDHPGFGNSDDLPDVEAMDDLVYHYLDLMDQIGLEQPIVVGASFGGWIAAELAVHSPHRISQLVLLTPAGLRIPEHPVTDTFAMSPGELIPALFKDPSVAAGMFPSEPDIDFVLRSYRDLGGFARFAWEPFMCNPKLERRLHRITVPSLVAWPEYDQIIPRAHAERYAELIPNARFEIVPDSGHALHLESPGAVAELVGAFLSE